jgi:hypothetical protein
MLHGVVWMHGPATVHHSNQHRPVWCCHCAFGLLCGCGWGGLFPPQSHLFSTNTSIRHKYIYSARMHMLKHPFVCCVVQEHHHAVCGRRGHGHHRGRPAGRFLLPWGADQRAQGGEPLLRLCQLCQQGRGGAGSRGAAQQADHQGHQAAAHVGAAAAGAASRRLPRRGASGARPHAAGVCLEAAGGRRAAAAADGGLHRAAARGAGVLP